MSDTPDQVLIVFAAGALGEEVAVDALAWDTALGAEDGAALHAAIIAALRRRGEEWRFVAALRPATDQVLRTPWQIGMQALAHPLHDTLSAVAPPDAPAAAAKD